MACLDCYINTAPQQNEQSEGMASSSSNGAGQSDDSSGDSLAEGVGPGGEPIQMSTWTEDPMHSADWDLAGPPSRFCAIRVKRDMSSLYTEPLPGIFVVPEEENFLKVHCLVIGPFDTPYEGGFFHFVVRFGPQYPLHPPRVRLLTTGGDTVRFNPNLYRNGKVCLSILGTWRGPAWSPASTLSSVLLSLQSLMNEKPYFNEPGYERERCPDDSERYNTIIAHEMIRVSVCQQLEGQTTAPQDLISVMKASFLDFYDHYVEICQNNIHKDGERMNDPFGEKRGIFQYGELLKRLEVLKDKIEKENPYCMLDQPVEDKPSQTPKSCEQTEEDKDEHSSVSEDEHAQL